MVQKVKKSKKKVVSSKANALRKATKPENHDQQQSSSSGEDELEPNNQNWTPMQLEQIGLSKKLDNYIGGFQKKLLRLNFQPSNRELVILFIMNLHPRWRRMVEPVELSCSSWVEAAAFARLHCARVSAILGCEDRSDAIFKTSDSKALRDSGYFAPDDTDQKLDAPPPSISHLLKSEQDVESDKSDTESSLPPATKTKQPATATIADQKKQPLHVPKRTTEERIQVESTATKASPSVSPSVSHSSTSESSHTLKPDIKDTAASLSSLSSSSSSSSSSSPPTAKTETQAKVQQAIKHRKEKEKQLQQQKKRLEKTSDQMETLLTNVPKQHLGVNLTFLELPIHGKQVKGLLTKLSWKNSAISIDCAHRLGLKIKPSNHLCISTDFGHVDSVGILTLPINHPADPAKTKSEMEIQVLPMIYGGKVDLVLGADFFCRYNATLNIRTRAINLLNKETPYTVEKLVE